MDRKLENDLRTNLKKKERESESENDYEKKSEKYIDAAILFFGTLGPLYFLFFLAYNVFTFSTGMALNMVDLPFSWMLPLIHAAIWVASIYSVYRKRSVLDDLVKRL